MHRLFGSRTIQEICPYNGTCWAVWSVRMFPAAVLRHQFVNAALHQNRIDPVDLFFAADTGQQGDRHLSSQVFPECIESTLDVKFGESRMIQRQTQITDQGKNPPQLTPPQSCRYNRNRGCLEPYRWQRLPHDGPDRRSFLPGCGPTSGRNRGVAPNRVQKDRRRYRYAAYAARHSDESSLPWAGGQRGEGKSLLIQRSEKHLVLDQGDFHRFGHSRPQVPWGQAYREKQSH